MKKRNQKFNLLQLNKVKVSHIFGGVTDPNLDENGEKKHPKSEAPNCATQVNCTAGSQVRACNPR